MGFAIVLLLGAQLSTNFLIAYYQDTARSVGIAEEVVLEYELNPVARLFLGIERFKIIYSFVIAPGTLLALYYFLRRRYRNDILVLESYAFAFLCFTGLDFLNNISIVLGILLQ